MGRLSSSGDDVMGRTRPHSVIKSIQRITYTNTSTSTANVSNTISQVNEDNTVLVHNSSNGHTRGISAWENYYYNFQSSPQIGAYLDSSTNVIIRRIGINSSNRRNNYIEIQVVEYY